MTGKCADLPRHESRRSRLPWKSPKAFQALGQDFVGAQHALAYGESLVSEIVSKCLPCQSKNVRDVAGRAQKPKNQILGTARPARCSSHLRKVDLPLLFESRSEMEWNGQMNLGS
jgi:hypothetical protein